MQGLLSPARTSFWFSHQWPKSASLTCLFNNGANPILKAENLRIGSLVGTRHKLAGPFYVLILGNWDKFCE